MLSARTGPSSREFEKANLNIECPLPCLILLSADIRTKCIANYVFQNIQTPAIIVKKMKYDPFHQYQFRDEAEARKLCRNVLGNESCSFSRTRYQTARYGLRFTALIDQFEAH